MNVQRGAFLALALAAGCGGAGAPAADTVELTTLRFTADGPQAVVDTVPRSYVNALLAERTAAARGERVATRDEALVSQESWTCSGNDMWMADSSWSHFTCAKYDFNASTGTCGDLASFPRYWYFYNGKEYFVPWSHAVRFFWPGNWQGCWTGNHDCTGTGENFSAFQDGGTCDPNGSGCGWTTADTVVQSANSIYANACPG